MAVKTIDVDLGALRLRGSFLIQNQSSLEFEEQALLLLEKYLFHNSVVLNQVHKVDNVEVTLYFRLALRVEMLLHQCIRVELFTVKRPFPTFKKANTPKVLVHQITHSVLVECLIDDQMVNGGQLLPRWDLLKQETLCLPDPVQVS